MSEGVEVIWWEDKQLKNPNYTRNLKEIFYAINTPLKSIQLKFVSGNSGICRPETAKATENLFDKLIEIYEDQ